MVNVIGRNCKQNGCKKLIRNAKIDLIKENIKKEVNRNLPKT